MPTSTIPPSTWAKWLIQVHTENDSVYVCVCGVLLHSYRPISKLPYLSKVVERVVAKQFISHANIFDLLSTHQSAYQQHHSTETAVLSAHNDLVCAVDDGKVTILVLLDLSAAFDTADHDILLSVLRDQFSIEDTAYNWFHSYLSDRQRSFVHNDQQTVFFPLDCSVPQGSVLGTLEFVAYTEDSSDVVAKHDINQHAYANDNQLHTSCFPSDVSRSCSSASIRMHCRPRSVVRTMTSSTERQ